MRPPSFGEIEQFCLADGWQVGTTTTHVPYERLHECPGFEPVLLETAVSKSRSKEPSQGRWRSILKLQLQVSEEEFWRVLKQGGPAHRPCPPPPIPVEGVPIALWYQLRQQLHMGRVARGGVNPVVRLGH